MVKSFKDFIYDNIRSFASNAHNCFWSVICVLSPLKYFAYYAPLSHFAVVIQNHTVGQDVQEILKGKGPYYSGRRTGKIGVNCRY